MKLTVNGVDIEIEGAVEVEVDGNTVKIKTASQPYFVPSPFWVEPPRPTPYWEPDPWRPSTTWITTSDVVTTSSDMLNVSAA